MKNMRRSTVSVLDFGRMGISDAAADGLRDDDFDTRFVLGWEGTGGGTEFWNEGSPGCISDGDECDRFSDHVDEGSPPRGSRNDFVDHV